MKKLLIITLCVFLVGCSYGMKDYIEDPRTILRDPLTVDYRQDLNDLERSYSRQEITYAEYIEKKRELEVDYDRDVQKRGQYE